MFLLLVFLMNVQASSLDHRAQMLLSVKSHKEFKIKTQSYNELQKIESSCEFELSNTLVPKSCYKLKLSKEKIQVVDQACERAVRVMKEEVSVRGLSPFCADLVNKRNGDLRYNKVEESPEQFVLKNE